MILDDGQGTAIDTESKPLTLEQQMTNLANQLRELKREIGRLGRTKERQQLQVRFDSKLTEYKRLVKRAEKEEARRK